MNPDDPHPAAIDPDQLRALCDVRFMRRSGPGGQNRNKVETAVVLTHRTTGLTAEANERRSQAENGRVALHRLRLTLAVEVRRPWNPDHPPSLLWQSRCQGGRININPDHEDFPALLAEALDVLEAVGMDLHPAAEHFGCSMTQLTRFLKLAPEAMILVNQTRRQNGLRPLR